MFGPGAYFRTSRKASHAPKIFRKRRSFIAAATSRIGPVRVAANPVPAIGSSHESSTTWGTWFPAGRVTSILSTRSITAPSAASISTRTRPNMLCPNPTTPIASFPGRATRRGGRLALSSRQLAFVARSSGFCPFRHHPKLGGGRGKKGGPPKWTTYLDWALADFSGYIAADELYDGPFCVLVHCR